MLGLAPLSGTAFSALLAAPVAPPIPPPILVPAGPVRLPPAFGDLDFQAAMQRLLPRGIIWRTDPGAVLSATLLALAPTYTRSTAAAAQVLVDADPATTQNLLAEWEYSLGLPDPCTVVNPTLQQRQAAVRAKFGARGSMSIGFFIELAAELGFAITITEFAPFVVGRPVGGPLYGPAWAFAWQVGAPMVTTFYFAVGVSAAGDPLTTYDAPELVCRITRNAPAETTVYFVFS